MESKLKNLQSLTLQDCEKITTPFSINDILTKENEAKSEFENGMLDGFGAKSFLKPASYSKEDFGKKEGVSKSLNYYDDCHFRDYADDGALDMSRKPYPVTELSGKWS